MLFLSVVRVEQSKANKTNRFLYAAIKLLIAVSAFVFIYKSVISKENFSSIVSSCAVIFDVPGNGIKIVTVILLMLVNWSVEAIKWKMMMQRLEVIPFLRSLAAVFSGLTVSFFTPNRIGEYAGRIFHLRKADRIKGTLVTILENLSQLIITIIIGSVSLVIYLNKYLLVHAYILWVTGVLMVLFSLAVLFIFLEVPFLDQSLLKFKKIKKMGSYLEALSSYKKSELLLLLALAFLRYVIFTYQFFILLEIFGIYAPYPDVILLINMVFFVMTLVPTFALTEIGVRGAVATYFLSRISPDSLAILNSSVALWLINLVVPALLGILFIFQFRFGSLRQ